MSKEQPTILALDFDGVLCDGLVEYFQTAWRAYCQIWSASKSIPQEGLASQFYRLRPVIETGWEMPVLIRSLLDDVPEARILADWHSVVPQYVKETGLTPAEIAAKVDQIRDEWIAADLDNWLAQHRFYPGVIERLQKTLSSSTYPVIITTKEQRFVRQLLQRQHVDLPELQVFGKEVHQPKAQTLRNLFQKFSKDTTKPVKIWFIEDRLKTLQSIQTQSDMSYVRLYLADWGYNTSDDRETADQDPRLHLLSLTAFVKDFSEWS